MISSLSQNIVDVFTHRLLSWYTEHGRTDLPWRQTTDPYRIWISEIILQQTRVVQGHDYYLRFIDRFPDAPSLAAASEDEVMRLWQGLGYYSRARNLHAAARQIVEMGGFPRLHEDILRLKGVGAYTAAAISSFAFGDPYAVVDGNVFRVLSRYFGITSPIDSAEGKRTFTDLAGLLLDKRQPADYNSAMMDFGALQCRPLSPACADCPMADRCHALANRCIDSLPVKEKRTEVTERYMIYWFIHDGSNLLLQRRTGKDIWRGLYQPLLMEYGHPSGDEEALHDLQQRLPADTSLLIDMPAIHLRHLLTHRRLHLTFYSACCPTLPSMDGMQAVPLSELDRYAMPRAILNALERWTAVRKHYQ